MGYLTIIPRVRVGYEKVDQPTHGMFYLGDVLLRYVLIYNLEVPFNFHLPFLQLNVIKLFTVQ